MKKVYTLVAALTAMTAFAAEPGITILDLTKSTTPLEFNAETGAWDGTYNDDAESIDSQCFSFVHNSMGEYKTWWGFTASISADNSKRADFVTYQFSNMAKGGIVLNEDGTVKTDDNGAPVTDASVPYLVSYCSSMMARRPAEMAFADGKTYEPQSVYVNLSSYPYYSIEDGDAFARAFNNGDKFTLTIHGVKPDETESTVEVTMASYTNGDLTINRGWKLVDLTSMGEVNELYFSMKSTDSGIYGDNTPDYFCMDKLCVKESDQSIVAAVRAADARIKYDRDTNEVSVAGAGYAKVYDSTGVSVMSTEAPLFSISHLPAGVYIIRAGGSSIKIAK